MMLHEWITKNKRDVNSLNNLGVLSTRVIPYYTLYNIYTEALEHGTRSAAMAYVAKQQGVSTMKVYRAIMLMESYV